LWRFKLLNEHPSIVASEIEATIRSLEKPIVPNLRAIRLDYSKKLSESDGEFVLEVARRLNELPDHSWVGLELVRYHEPALNLIRKEHLEEFGRCINSWGTVDAFAGFLAGPAWLRGQVSDELIFSWARSENRWWRRAALVCTIVLNSPSEGGKGDTPRTMTICEILADDRDDMVVKALSWALRRLLPHDEEAVRRFLEQYESRLAARVKREVRNKMETGVKNPHRKSRH